MEMCSCGHGIRACDNPVNPKVSHLVCEQCLNDGLSHDGSAHTGTPWPDLDDWAGPGFNTRNDESTS